MTSSGPGWQAYRDAFRSDVYQLVAWGYEAARGVICASSEEQEITGFIAEAIDARLDDPLTDERFDRYELSEDNPLAGESRTGKRRRRADIRIRSRVLKPRPSYILEAKRLRRGGPGVKSYLGPDGLRRFLDDTSYAASATEAAMVGYIQSDTPPVWANEIASELTADPELRARTGLAPYEPTALQHCFVSSHVQAINGEVEIYHLLLDCT